MNTVHVDGQGISQSAPNCYLGSIIHETGGIEEDMIRKIKAGW